MTNWKPKKREALNIIKLKAGKNWDWLINFGQNPVQGATRPGKNGEIKKTSKNCTVQYIWQRWDYSCQQYNIAFACKLKKRDSIHREGIRIYTCLFRTSPVEALHVEENDPHLEPRRNDLGLKCLYKLKSNSSYIEILNTLDDRDDQNYEGNEK